MEDIKPIVRHQDCSVIVCDEEGNILFKIDPEEAMKMANSLFDQAEKALRGTDRLHKYE